MEPDASERLLDNAGASPDLPAALPRFLFAGSEHLNQLCEVLAPGEPLSGSSPDSSSPEGSGAATPPAGGGGFSREALGSSFMSHHGSSDGRPRLQHASVSFGSNYSRQLPDSSAAWGAIMASDGAPLPAEAFEEQPLSPARFPFLAAHGSSGSVLSRETSGIPFLSRMPSGTCDHSNPRLGLERGIRCGVRRNCIHYMIER